MGSIFIGEIFRLFDMGDDDDEPQEPVFLVTIADKSHLTTDQPQRINLSRIKRKLGAGLKGLSYVGMIEPGYYNVIYNALDEPQKNIVSWHGHFLVWGVSKSQLQQHLGRIKSRFTPIMPGRCAVHHKTVEPEQFGYKLWYMIKSPRKEYSIGKRHECDGKTGARNSSKIAEIASRKSD